MYERYNMAIYFYIYVIKLKFYKISYIFAKLCSQLFVNMFNVKNSWLWKDIFHLVFDRILYVIEEKGYPYYNNKMCSIKA